MPRTCQWPANPDASDFEPPEGEGEICGVAEPSFDAHVDPTVDPLPVCAVDAQKAKAAGYTVTPTNHVPSRRTRTAQEIVEAAIDAVTIDLDDMPPDPRDELGVMRVITEALDPFSSAAQRRIITWAADFYEVPT